MSVWWAWSTPLVLVPVVAVDPAGDSFVAEAKVAARDASRARRRFIRRILMRSASVVWSIRTHPASEERPMPGAVRRDGKFTELRAVVTVPLEPVLEP